MEIIVDIDGTLADNTHRQHLILGTQKDWDAFFDACPDDAPIFPVVSLVKSLLRDKSHVVIFVTGRPERIREETLAWLRENVGVDDPILMMRPDGDRRPDYEIKADLLSELRSCGVEPELAIDDRPAVAAMWRSEGLLVLQCDEGDF